MKILVIQIKQLGDVLTSTVIFEALKQKFPSCEIHYLITPKSIAIVENNPFIDKLLFYDDQKNVASFFNSVSSIRKEKYDVIIDAYCKTNASLLCWLSSVKKTISFDKTVSRLLCSHVIERNKESFSKSYKSY
ncbi:MAG: glycosyltransferase family 9 protein [Flavobacterium sp.]|nr:glycosyltransferase family 9 protein [Flavobacterium sp.]